MHMIKLLLMLLLTYPGPIYSLSFYDSQGNLMHFSDFAGKKILLVNTATASSRAGQYASLEQLYEMYKDSLVVIAFPSDDFGHEKGNDSTIRQAVIGQCAIHFILASKISVSGDGQDAVYQWLTQAALNGRASNAVKNDFYKFLIDGAGNWMGVFSDDVDPMSQQIQDAIKL